jgi:hypothetical protein
METCLYFISNLNSNYIIVKHTRLDIYKTLARVVLTYESEAWTIKKSDENRLLALEIKFMRLTAGYTLLDNKQNEDVLEELEIQ